MKNIKKHALIKQKQLPPNDEFYTRKEDIETALPEWVLSNKIVYCCADSDESEFVKYFKQPGKCKKLIYTSDDFRTHEDLFEKCDIVVTNPPFSLKKDLAKILEKYKKDWILILPMIPPVSNLFFVKGFRFGRVESFSNTDMKVNCRWVSNIGTEKHPYGFSYEEAFGHPMKITDHPVEILTKGKFMGFPKYGRKEGFNPNEKGWFVITVDSACSEFEPYPFPGKNPELRGELVRWRKYD